MLYEVVTTLDNVDEYSTRVVLHNNALLYAITHKKGEYILKIKINKKLVNVSDVRKVHNEAYDDMVVKMLKMSIIELVTLQLNNEQLAGLRDFLLYTKGALK